MKNLNEKRLYTILYFTYQTPQEEVEKKMKINFLSKERERERKSWTGRLRLRVKEMEGRTENEKDHEWRGIKEFNTLIYVIRIKCACVHRRIIACGIWWSKRAALIRFYTRLLHFNRNEWEEKRFFLFLFFSLRSDRDGIDHTLGLDTHIRIAHRTQHHHHHLARMTRDFMKMCRRTFSAEDWMFR